MQKQKKSKGISSGQKNKRMDMNGIFVSLFLIVLTVVGLAQLSKRPLSKDAITLKAGKEKANISYKDLGVTVDTADLNEGQSKLGLASLFSSEKSKNNRNQKTKLSINEAKLVSSVVSMFPALNTPEEASASFYVTYANQKTKPTFNVRKLIDQILNDRVGRLRQSGIEIDIVPNDEEILESLPVTYFEPKEVRGKILTIRASGDEIAKQEWKIPLSEDNWTLSDDQGVSINTEKLINFFNDNIVNSVQKPVQNATIWGFTDEGKAVRANVTGIVQNGVKVPIERNIEKINDAIKTGVFDIDLEIQIEKGMVINKAEIDLSDMELIGLGRSNYAGSPEGRAFNIKKGLRERMSNIIIPPGAAFSFNDFLGSLTVADGWRKALGIFNGGDLKPTLGGGLCQVSTTVYRAALRAGLQIIDRRSHSLYVKYYREYGDGLDSTIFIGGQDLVFLNDTPSYIFMQAYDDGDDGYVKIFGTSDGRSVTLDGPYHFNNIPAGKNYKPRQNEIAWFRSIQWPDGQNKEETIVSRYKVLPHS